jgi:TniQ
MGYEQPKWLLHLEGSSYRLREEDIPWLCRKEDFLYLEQLLDLDEETLYVTTLHRFASVLQDGVDLPVCQNARLIARPLLSGRNYFQDPLYTQVCPVCLDQTLGYDRLYWRMPFILLCPSHALPLRVNCPSCKKLIPALRPELARCPFCKQGEYRRPTATARVSEDCVLFQAELLFLQALGVPISQTHRPASLFNDTPLMNLHPADYFHLYGSLTGTLSHLFWHEDILKLSLRLDMLTQQERATHSMLYEASLAPEIVLFHGLFVKWPDNFFHFLDIAYRAFILAGYHEEILESFHRLFEEELSKESFAWVRQAHRDHLEQFQREKQARAESQAFQRLYDAMNGLY